MAKIFEVYRGSGNEDLVEVIVADDYDEAERDARRMGYDPRRGYRIVEVEE